MLELRPHQLEVVDKLREGFANGHRCQLLYAPTGFGKTETAMSIMQKTSEKYKKTAMIMDRIVLVDQTSARLDKYGIPHGVMQSGHWRYRPLERIQICSAQTLEKRNEFPEIDLLIVDECFSAGTKIATPLGDIDIELVRCGDSVYNQHGIGIVQAVSIKPSNDLYRLEFDDGTVTECTGNHPHFTEQGWKTTRELEIGAYFFSVKGMRLLWERVETLDQVWRERQDDFSNAGTQLEYAGYLLSLLLKEIEEPNEQSSKPFENEGEATGNQAQAYKTWRQRAITSLATISSTSCSWGGMGVGVSSCDKNAEGQWLSNVLQVGLSKSFYDDRNRNRRGFSHDIGEKSAGQKENRSPCFPRLVSVSHIKRESATPVFNLQVSGHPSYFANGKLVHNCHVTRAGTIKFIKENPKVKVIGLTATPFTKGLGDIYTHIVGATPTGELINNGWLCPLKIFIAKEIDMAGVKKVAGEWASEAVAERGMQITGDIVSEWHNKTMAIFGKPEKTIVFCSGVTHGRDLEAQFKQAGFNFVSISYKEDDQFKKDTIKEFSKPDSSIHGLIATDILTKGFDVTDVKIGISARPFSKSFSSHVQQLGRVMRTHDNKEFGVWLDHSGNYIRFRDDWDELYSDGVKRLKEGGEKAKAEPTEKKKKESKCPKCSALWTSPTDTCANCGHVRVRMNTVVNIPGEMLELQASNAKLTLTPQQLYSQLLYYARLNNKQDGWAYHKVREKFGKFPRGLEKIVEPPTTDTLKWIKSRAIAYAKGKSRRLDR